MEQGRSCIGSVSAVEPGAEGVELLWEGRRVWALYLIWSLCSVLRHIFPGEPLLHLIFVAELGKLGLMFQVPFSLLTLFLSPCIKAIFFKVEAVFQLSGDPGLVVRIASDLLCWYDTVSPK